MLSLWAYRQVRTICSSFPLVQLQGVYCQQLARCLVMSHKDYLIPEILAKVFVAGHTEIEAFLLPLLEGSSSQVVQCLYRYLCLFICSYYYLSAHIFISLQIIPLSAIVYSFIQFVLILKQVVLRLTQFVLSLKQVLIQHISITQRASPLVY